MVVVVTWGVLGVVATFDVEEEKEEDSLMEALVGVMRCGEDLGVLDRDRCPFILNVVSEMRSLIVGNGFGLWEKCFLFGDSQFKNFQCKMGARNKARSLNGRVV